MFFYGDILLWFNYFNHERVSAAAAECFHTLCSLWVLRLSSPTAWYIECSDGKPGGILRWPERRHTSPQILQRWCQTANNMFHSLAWLFSHEPAHSWTDRQTDRQKDSCSSRFSLRRQTLSGFRLDLLWPCDCWKQFCWSICLCDKLLFLLWSNSNITKVFHL